MNSGCCIWHHESDAHQPPPVAFELSRVRWCLAEKEKSVKLLQETITNLFKLKSAFVLLFVSVLFYQEEHSVDFVFGDNGASNWLVSDKMDGCSNFSARVRPWKAWRKVWLWRLRTITLTNGLLMDSTSNVMISVFNLFKHQVLKKKNLLCRFQMREIPLRRSPIIKEKRTGICSRAESKGGPRVLKAELDRETGRWRRGKQRRGACSQNCRKTRLSRAAVAEAAPTSRTVSLGAFCPLRCRGKKV